MLPTSMIARPIASDFNLAAIAWLLLRCASIVAEGEACQMFERLQVHADGVGCAGTGFGPQLRRQGAYAGSAGNRRR